MGIPPSGAFFVAIRRKERRRADRVSREAQQRVADMRSCEVVPPRISRLLVPLRGLVNGLSIPDRMPQIELAIGDKTDALVLRILEPLQSMTKR